MLETKTKFVKSQYRHPDWLALALAAGGLAIVVAVVVLTNSFRLMPDDPPIYDPDIYLAMAQSPANPLSHVPPFEWRILTPLIVSWLSTPALWGFFIVTMLALLACGWLIYKVCAVLSVPHPLWAIPLFFTCHYASAFLVQNYMIVDQTCLFFVLLAFYALFTGQSWLYIIALGVGALNKETVLAVAVAGLFYQKADNAPNPGHWWQRNWWLLVGAGLTGGVAVGLRWLIPGSSYSLPGEVSKNINLRLSGHLLRQLFSSVALSFGPMLLMMFYRPRHTLDWLRQHRALVVYFGLAVAQLIIASQNARLVVYGFVTVIPLVLVKLDLLSQRYKWKPFYLYSGVVTGQIIFYAVFWPHLLFWN